MGVRNMAAQSSLDHLAPPDLVEAALTKDQRGFLTLYGDTLLLVVRVGTDMDLATGLGSTAVRGSAGIAAKPIPGSMDFHTQIQPAGPGAMTATRAVEPRDLTRRLESGLHFVVPLRKRPGAEAAYAERISVGRARNKDVVLRHSSVSKFHGWFEVDEVGSFHFTDAGSSNGTRNNGTVLLPRERSALDVGDVIRFGSVEAALWSSRMLWDAIRGLVQASSRS
jgi:hypothetical protein